MENLTLPVNMTQIMDFMSSSSTIQNWVLSFVVLWMVISLIRTLFKTDHKSRALAVGSENKVLREQLSNYAKRESSLTLKNDTLSKELVEQARKTPVPPSVK